jgi:hypothetical protein
MREVSVWDTHEKRLELTQLLQENFLCYEGDGDVPSQIHSYLSTNFHELRSLKKGDSKLVGKAKNRWYVPDPRKEADLEKKRHQWLLKEFDEYRQTKGKLKVVRTEALRAGFKECWQSGDLPAIVEMAKRVKDEIIQEDPALLSGDPRQRMDWRSGFSSLESIQVPADRKFLVTRNYRQTVELSEWIQRLSVALFGEQDHVIEPTHEHGPEPTVAVNSSLNGALKSASASLEEWYGDEQDPFTALLLIGFDAGMKTRITNSLSNALEMKLLHVEKVEDGRMIERGRVSVADVPTVKGLEFDGVVVIVSKDTCALFEQSSPDAMIARNLLYVACSRARRWLKVILQSDENVLRRKGLYSDRTE